MTQLHTHPIPILAIARWPHRAARPALAIQQALLMALTLLALTLSLIGRVQLALDTAQRSPVNGLLPRPAPLAISAPGMAPIRVSPPRSRSREIAAPGMAPIPVSRPRAMRQPPIALRAALPPASGRFVR